VVACVPARANADAFFPNAGNPGYDVARYRLDLRYDPTARTLDGHARITARALESLATFHLDLRGLAVRRVTVRGRPAVFRRFGQELIITPAAPVHAGARFVTTVDYHGTPRPVIDPDGSRDGWIPTDDGAFVAGEPQGAPTWFPANDTPADKATYRISMTVPEALTAVGNGRLLRTITAGGRRTYVWSERRPMATYLATMTLGRFDITTKPGTVPIYIAVDPREVDASAAPLTALPRIVKFERKLIGPYPFETVGAIIDHNAGAGYALETQTKPLFDGAPDEETLAHELAHQWFGDSVTPNAWPNIWLNEGFATYVQWLWGEHAGGRTVDERFNDLFSIPASSPFWCVAPRSLPGPAEMFSGPVYDRGAMTLVALQRTVGDHAFRRILRAWASEHRYGNASTSDFVQLAERVSKSDLSAFFQTWLRTGRKPGSALNPCL
jgi:aminopeptidase N